VARRFSFNESGPLLKLHPKRILEIFLSKYLYLFIDEETKCPLSRADSLFFLLASNCINRGIDTMSEMTYIKIE